MEVAEMMSLAANKNRIATVLGISTFIAAALTFYISSTGSSITLIVGLAATLLLALTGVLSPRWIIFFALAISTLTGGPVLPDIAGFPFGVHGLFTSAILFSSIVTLTVHWRQLKLSWWISLVPFLIYLTWVFFRVLGSPSLSTAISNCIIIATPILLMPVVMLAVSVLQIKVLEKIYFWFTPIPILIVIFGLLTNFIYVTNHGFYSPFGLRTLSLYLMVALCFLLVIMRAHPSRRLRIAAAMFSILIVIIVVFSLSRTVIVLMFGTLILFILFLSQSVKSKLRFLLPIVILIGSSIIFIIFLRRSFPDLASIGLNSFLSGRRFDVWPVVIRDALANPWFGYGTGSVQPLTWAVGQMDHPHNDFLRVFYDQGGIGLILFLAAWLHCIFHQMRGWLYNRRIGESSLGYRLYLASFLAAIGIFASFTTDNTLVYVFVLMPAFILFAMADASSSGENIR
jgi:O-antigen ligase